MITGIQKTKYVLGNGDNIGPQGGKVVATLDRPSEHVDAYLTIDQSLNKGVLDRLLIRSAFFGHAEGIRGLIDRAAVVVPAGGTPATAAAHAKFLPALSFYLGSARVASQRTELALGIQVLPAGVLALHANITGEVALIGSDQSFAGKQNPHFTDLVYGDAQVPWLAGPCWLHRFRALNVQASGTDLYFQLFDQGDPLGGNEVPVHSVFVKAAGGDVDVDYTASPLDFQIGLQVGWSTTGDKYASAGSVATNRVLLELA